MSRWHSARKFQVTRFTDNQFIAILFANSCYFIIIAQKTIHHLSLLKVDFTIACLWKA